MPSKKGQDLIQGAYMRILVAGLAIGVFMAGSGSAQYVISAHSGVVQSVDGDAYLNDQKVQPKFGQFPDIKENQEFRTEEGRAEILLTPGVFLRMGEKSSIRMVSNKLTDTRVEVLTGSVMVESDDIQKNDAKDNVVMLLYKANTMLLEKHGLYRIDAEPARFQVYDGEAVVKGDSGQLTLKSGKETSLTGVLMAENFDKKTADDLYLWSNERSSYLAKASASSAATMRNSSGGSYGGGGYGGYGAGSYSPWQFNSMFGMFTYVPFSGIAYSPFGWGFWSPYSLYNSFYSPLYYPYAYGGYGGYGGTVGRLTSFAPYAGNRFATGRSPMGRGYSAPSGGVFGGGRAGGSALGGGGMAAGGSGGMSGGGGGGGFSGGAGHGGGGGHGR
jgi:hypothetical protein